jgi:hypothetical protein
MIALYQGVSFISRVIRWRDWSDFSHAAWQSPRDGSVIEAWTGGVRHVASLDTLHTPGTRVLLLEPQLDSEEVASLERFLMSQVGKPYDYRSVWHFICRRPPHPADQDRWFCSELLFAGFQMIGRPLLLRVPRWKVTPGMLALSTELREVGWYTTGRAVPPDVPDRREGADGAWRPDGGGA